MKNQGNRNNVLQYMLFFISLLMIQVIFQMKELEILLFLTI